MTADPLFTIIILTHNRREYTEWCLRGLKRTAGKQFEVVFVDNGSTDGTLDILHSFASNSDSPPVKIIENSGNAGCSTARNQGAEQASGNFLVFMDNDVTVRTARWLTLLHDPLNTPGTGAVTPKLVFPFLPYNIQCAGAAVSSTGKVQFCGRGEASDSPDFDHPRELQCAISACIALPADVFRKSGGFDEAFNPVQYEDIDLCYRLRSMGYAIRYIPNVEMYHFENTTTQGSDDVRGTFQIIKNGRLFRDRWQHIFKTEDGPDDSDICWADIDRHHLSELHTLPSI